MNFFKAQDQSRTRTLSFIFLTLVGVGLIAGLLFGLLAILTQDPKSAGLLAALMTAALFLPIFLYNKFNAPSGFELSVLMNGIPLPDSLLDDRDIALRNVVEEMAIASGLPVPRIHVMRSETSINAFAAGTRPGEYAITVSQGALDHLTRDELQAVVAHEFAHILSEDMNLAQNLAVIVSGFLLLTRAGTELLLGNRRRSSKSGSEIALLGVGFVALGFLGRFWAQVMQATISREREYFADACSAQYTRNPEALAQALAKIFIHRGSSLKSSDKYAYAHIFFASPLLDSFFILSTHPKIEDRIQALLPQVQPQKYLTNIMNGVQPQRTKVQDHKKSSTEKIRDIDALLANAGIMTGSSLLLSQTFLREQKDFLEKMHDPELARMVLTILIIRSQINHLTLEDQLCTQYPQARPLIREVTLACQDDPQKLVFLFQLVCGALVALSEAEKLEIFQRIYQVFEADSRFSLFEIGLLASLQNILLAKKPSVRLGFRKAEEFLIDLLSHKTWDKFQLDQALSIFKDLQLLSLREKEVFLRGLGKNLVPQQEVQAYRLLALSIGVPLPPFEPQSRLQT
jgi:Zn-dependent protease with chaperone function